MRNANAAELKKYLRMKLGDDENFEDEIQKAKAAKLPGAGAQYDVWEVLLREFVQNNALIVHKKDISEISPSVWEYKQLTLIDLSHNCLTYIPEDICKLTKLKALRANDNQLSSLPLSLTMMESLTDLELASNQLSTFYEDTPYAKNLTKSSIGFLDLNGN